ncbi:MAG: hypothetical protein Pg6B_00930 [Candidatus Azobacteroides pseudotrichonymphae]|jgi:hypothetical protein|nr:MAG: hypothetical protein Pg6B_00930 [Candidatus Azobacteroides pseudotrichonymphae]
MKNAYLSCEIKFMGLKNVRLLEIFDSFSWKKETIYVSDSTDFQI